MGDLDESVFFDLRLAINELKAEIKRLREEIGELRKAVRDNTDSHNS